jgi:hypothetical protein
MRKLSIGLAAAVGTLVLATGASAVKFNFPFFDDSTGTDRLKLNGDAFLTGAKQGHQLRLTPAEPDQRGSAFTKRKVLDSGRSFKTRFRISLHDGSGDGMAFLINGKGKGALGDGGGGLGYGGIDPSVAVEIDTYPNKGESPIPHLAVTKGGDPGNELASFDFPYPVNEHDTTVWVDYVKKSKRLKVFAAETLEKPGAPFINVKANLGRIFDRKPARVGFTASTGGAWQAHDVVSWKFKQRKRR